MSVQSTVAMLREKLATGRDDLWNVVEWLAMPVFILYPQLAVLKWYRYGS